MCKLFEINEQKDFSKLFIYSIPPKHFTETVAQKCSVKKALLKILQNSQENTFVCWSLFFNKVAGLQLY